MIYIVDFGSQLAHLISRRYKDMGVKTKILLPESVIAEIALHKPDGLIFSGGPASVYALNAPKIDPSVFQFELPILGICYGWQLMAQLLNGKVQNTSKEYGLEKLQTKGTSDIFADCLSTLTVVMSHGDTVTALPEGFLCIASTQSVSYAAVKHIHKPWYGLQFHPEAEHTENGSTILRNFAKQCGVVFQSHSLVVSELVTAVQKQVGEGKVICAVSGGVDSSVAAAVIAKAIGRRLIPVYVESGLMRAGTLELVERIFKEIVPAELVVVHAEDDFATILRGLVDPEQKRKAIGKLYIELFNAVAVAHNDVHFLGQGTIYSDVIESKGTQNAVTIKSHHNVGGLPSEMKLSLVEPLRHLYKDEVRSIGRMLGLPSDVIEAQPFPGPGFAIRVRGEVTPDRLAKIRVADQIVIEEMKYAKLWQKVFQCFPVLTGAMSTAVKGDERVFAEVIALRAYESTDVMTSQVAELPYEVLKRIAGRIVNEVPDISRVVYDITGKPPATMEWE